MGQTTILAAGSTAAVSSDVTLLAGQEASIGIFAASKIPVNAKLVISMETPAGDTAVADLTRVRPAVVLSGPGTYRVRRPAMTGSVGVFLEDGASS